MKRIIIIGASSGIGKELALRYAEEGNRVAITGRRCALLNEIKQAYPTQIFPSCFDVRAGENNVQFQNLVETLGGLDLFIYNAGFGLASEEYDPETEIITTETNVNGGIELISAAFQYFLQQGKGQIAVTSSVAGIRGNGWAPAYNASKAFLSIYAEGLNSKAKKLRKDIVVTDLRPGFLDTKKASVNKRFWVSPPQKAATQIKRAIEQKKRIAYITKRWWVIGQLLKLLPFALYRRLA